MRKIIRAKSTLAGGCASYTTPGDCVAIGSLAESDINALISVQAAATFPAHIAVARILAPGYVSYH